MPEKTGQKTAFDAAVAEKMISEGSRELGLELDESQIRQLVTYLALLSRWNKVYNLTAIRSSESMVSHHILDSLAVMKSFEGVENLLDVGSGAGLPGLVLAVACPEMQVSLIDAVQKKTAFLSQVKAELRLKNVVVHTGRVEKLRVPEKFDVIISRAFSDLSVFAEVSGHLLAEGGRFFAMKGVLPSGEIGALSSGLKLQGVVPLEVPFLDAERHLLILEKTVSD